MSCAKFAGFAEEEAKMGMLTCVASLPSKNVTFILTHFARLLRAKFALQTGELLRCCDSVLELAQELNYGFFYTQFFL